MTSTKFIQKLKSLLTVTSSSAVIFGSVFYYRNDEKFFENIAMPITRKFADAETSHKIVMFACKWNLLPPNKYEDPEMLNTQICGIKLKNPLGLAAGFDKDGEAIKSLHNLGFGFVEIGSVCPEEQSGSSKPSVFNLDEDKTIIHRHVYASKGHEYVVPNMRYLRRKIEYEGIIGVNMGRNKWSDPIHDYSMGVKVFSPTANYLVINIEQRSHLEEYTEEVRKARLLFDIEKQRPIFIKLSPDLNYEELKEIINVTKKNKYKVDGFIISDATKNRYSLKSTNKNEDRGLSGQILREKSTKMIEDVYKLTSGKVAIIGSGGIFNGQDAYEKILAGASAVQIYTSFMYQGPPVVNKIKRELHELLVNNGYKNVTEAVGKGVKLEKKFIWFL
ncbi:CLUMA_CG009098, isoform A [Clunio marinus]|uniref:Dihydroorotate dehydrogenase (quinone), mitochondrial n=1 Tax=Clunio marinus TaxID=568069 RepID=A0A1J1I5U3_9DIPT|nr:CLUMA_CG009098, isoform A [Clunio marinus]